MKRLLIAIFDFCSSIKLAVLLLLAMAFVFAWGTIIESRYGTPEAQRLIFKGWPTTLLMFTLIVNLACAVIDRMPLKRHHTGFAITHLGIILLIIGSFITQQRGIDGSLPLAIGETGDAVLVQDTELVVYQNVDGKPFALIHQKPIEFAGLNLNRKAFSLPLVDKDELHVVDFLPRAQRQVKTQNSTLDNALPALKFKLFNNQVKVEEWLTLDGKLPAFYDLGPAQVSFVAGPVPIPPAPSNHLAFSWDPKNPTTLRYTVFSMRQTKPLKSGEIKPGQTIDTGWMNLQVSLEQFIPRSQTDVSYLLAPITDTLAPRAIKVRVGSNESWFELGQPHEIKGQYSTYFVSYTLRRYSLGFQLKLDQFKIQRYGGTNLPASYESSVTVVGGPKTVISMNEPLHYGGYTFYQSSYEMNERGEPAISVFSVNYDPGRPLKYLGSLAIVIGIITMFYIKPVWSRKSRTNP
ncbi:MAG: cytochrome c biogenesis protein ResB [Oligoflexia bacterium]|nr:cytochrome c biogenesis protein ResB [Oligoflexia bacterium]